MCVAGNLGDWMSATHGTSDTKQVIRKERRLGLFHQKFLTTFLAYMDDDHLYLLLRRIDWPLKQADETKPLPAPPPLRASSARCSPNSASSAACSATLRLSQCSSQRGSCAAPGPRRRAWGEKRRRQLAEVARRKREAESAKAKEVRCLLYTKDAADE